MDSFTTPFFDSTTVGPDDEQRQNLDDLAIRQDQSHLFLPLKMFGVNFHTVSLEQRELFSLPAAELDHKLHHWKEVFPTCEAVLLSTCNRTEFYLASPDGTFPDLSTLLRYLYDSHRNFDDATLSSQLKIFTEYSERKVVEHLFSVITSLDSMVLGEPQILSQVKNAYQFAVSHDSAGPITHAAFQTALRVAKRVSSETEIFQHRISIPSVAVTDFALHIFETLRNKKTLVLGAGEMAEETLKYLSDLEAPSITVVNRNRERAETLAQRWNGHVLDWDQRSVGLSQADIVIAATGASTPVITQSDYRSVAVQRRGRPLFMLDLSVPRNLDPRLNECPNVYLYTLDDLQEACQRNRQVRDKEIPRAQKIIAQETDLFLQEMKRRTFDHFICELRGRWNEIKEAEVRRLMNKCPELNEHSRHEIHYAFDRLVNKLLHPTLSALQDESKLGSPHRFLDAIRHLFRL